MTHADIVALYRYNDWANERMLRAMEAVTPEQFLREPGERSSSIRDLLAHLAGADWVDHSTYHRGQLASKLRQVGAAAPETDYDVFAASR